jgi:hypothetical protein
MDYSLLLGIEKVSKINNFGLNDANITNAELE